METLAPAQKPLLNLVKDLAIEIRTFVHQELQLAKTELLEKVSDVGQKATSLVIGGAVAFAGAIAFLIGVGLLLAYAFEAAGLAPLLAEFLGLAVVGLLAGIGGGALFAYAKISLTKTLSAPWASAELLGEAQGNVRTNALESMSSEELKVQVAATENHLSGTLDELGQRVNPRYINARVKGRLQANPYPAGMIAMAAGFVSGLVLMRRRARA